MGWFFYNELYLRRLLKFNKTSHKTGIVRNKMKFMWKLLVQKPNTKFYQNQPTKSRGAYRNGHNLPIMYSFHMIHKKNNKVYFPKTGNDSSPTFYVIKLACPWSLLWLAQNPHRMHQHMYLYITACCVMTSRTTAEKFMSYEFMLISKARLWAASLD